ncbi:MAG: DNA repair protein RadA [Desulfobacterota bacterium]|nr:DNA repair protein RadA [Thermodesulfobacteriota bacterium]
MAKTKTIYFCQNCGYQSSKWLGKSPECDECNTISEEIVSAGDAFSPSWLNIPLEKSSPRSLTEIKLESEKRIRTYIGEFDRVLGGGIVSGSVILIGGDPGIGKSTLLLQALNRLASSGKKVLYVSGEESLSQTKMRAERLGITSLNLFVQAENSLENIIKGMIEIKPATVAIDSIQTVFISELQSAPGTVSQVRESAARLVFLAKKIGIPIFLVGHVTKEGAIAGPRVLEHMVDTVLYFEGDQGHQYRILRAVKNRFGSTNEIGVFEMKESGLEEIASPSEFFLSERPLNVAGSVVVACIEGSRPLLVELQALVSATNFSVPRRTSLGVDYNRVSLLIAVLEKRANLSFFNYDIFVNIAGGIRIDEPAVDLGVVMALTSSFRNRALDSSVAVFGEVGLTGEVRAISQPERRIKEAAKMGFTRCLIPKNNLNYLSGDLSSIECIGVSSIEQALDFL